MFGAREVKTLGVLYLVLLTAMCELTQPTSPSNFSYPSTTILNNTNLNMRGGSVKVHLPWPILMHGQVYYDIDVWSNSSLVFGNLTMKIGYSAGGSLNNLLAIKTSDNFTLQYQGVNNNNGAANSWAITFFKDGYQKFILQVNNNSSGDYQFCEWTGCYQSLSISTPVIYSQCSIASCRSHEQDCANEDNCRRDFGDCFGDGVASCINEVAFYISISAITAAIFIIIFLCFCVKRCSRNSCNCRCSCRWLVDCCQCLGDCCAHCWSNCCPRQHRAPEPNVYGDPIAPVEIVRRDSANVQLTELHHPVTVDELRKMECAICMDVGVDIMTQCEHYFHWKCLEEWLGRKSDCPYCRNHLSRKYYQACLRCEQFFMPAHINGRVSGGLVCTRCRAINQLNETNQPL